MRVRSWPSICFAASLCTACGGGSGDGDLADASTGAPDLCPGQLTVTGEYVDWDSTVQTFRGIFDAVFTERDQPARRATTAPNGRVILCTDRDADTVLDVSQADYLPLVFSVSARAAVRGSFAARGLTPARAGTLFSDELGVARQAGAAHVLVDLFQPGASDQRSPALGAGVALGAGGTGYTAGADGKYTAGATVTHDSLVFFPNVPVGAGATDLVITPPGGKSCKGREAIVLQADAIAFTSVACE